MINYEWIKYEGAMIRIAASFLDNDAIDQL